MLHVLHSVMHYLTHLKVWDVALHVVRPRQIIWMEGKDILVPYNESIPVYGVWDGVWVSGGETRAAGSYLPVYGGRREGA